MKGWAVAIGVKLLDKHGNECANTDDAAKFFAYSEALSLATMFKGARVVRIEW